MKNQKQKSRTTPAEAFTQLILETFRFNGRLLAAGDRLTKELDLSSALWQVLGAIDEAPLPVAQIARNMGLTRQSVRRTANVLREKGFVEFQENPNHRRAKLVVLTKQGRNVLDQATKIQIDWSNRIVQDLSASELNAAMQIIRTLSERL
ncbi:Transcriptional regulator, MarR family [Olavius sp. associated proteobacterium Delta 1]|nr:Transcriptional regulator, MarR family [Olavius sp. associated proteobacterium Delta 1]